MDNHGTSKKLDISDQNNIDWGPVPHCFTFMQGRIIDYVAGQSLTVAFPVLPIYLNPARTMQGGFITAAFDNVFGPLCYSATGTPKTTTVDITTSYHRPISEGDELIITAMVKAQGKTKIHMAAEAYNRNKQLIATAATNYIHIK
ncbi:HotDog domain [Syntrophomonas zehnderi OL-4]|uniref:HotDog domain n=1 Tax=Syntrophomonas zehnderi OL-4 TaxID=690567 RepID=A0A0E3W322_9FIRM|nr:PaaI family thioesterase [Syntrophomonas zehnderi]CFX41896.1 HotDog domain [Syntrophomonas zehnderi OL-4]